MKSPYKEPAFNSCSDVTLLFEHLPGEIEHFETFSHLQENQLVQWFFIKYILLLFFLFLNIGSIFCIHGEI